MTDAGPNGARILLDTVSTAVMGDDEALFRIGEDGDWARDTATPGATRSTESSYPVGDGFEEEIEVPVLGGVPRT